MAVSKRLRYEVLRRDNHACKYCGLAAPEVKLTVDHVVPIALGGSDEPSNLVAACADCNSGKSASSPDAAIVADVDAKAVRWSQAMNLAVEQRAGELAIDRANTTWFDTAWTSWTRGDEALPRDANWKNSILRFLAGGLDQEFIRDAIATAMGNDRLPDTDRWRYFCGICWREMDKIRELTSAIVEADGAEAPPGRSSAEFDYMVMFDEFLDGLVPALGGNPEVRRYVDRSLYEAMPGAHAEWTWSVLPDDDGEATELARKRMADLIREHMVEVTRWREMQGGPNGA